MPARPNAPPRCGFGGNLPGEKTWQPAAAAAGRSKPAAAADKQPGARLKDAGYLHFATGEPVNMGFARYHSDFDVPAAPTLKRSQEKVTKKVKEITIEHEQLGSVVVQPWQDPATVIQEFERQQDGDTASAAASIEAAPIDNLFLDSGLAGKPSLKRARELQKAATAQYGDGKYSDARSTLSRAIVECDRCIQNRKQHPTAPPRVASKISYTEDTEALDVTDLEDLDAAMHADVDVMLKAALLCQRVSASIRDGDIEDALGNADEAVKLAPRSAKAHCCLGEALIAKKEFAEAVLELSRSIELDGGYLLARMHMKTCRAKLKEDR